MPRPMSYRDGVSRRWLARDRHRGVRLLPRDELERRNHNQQLSARWRGCP
jgi:hypothetical protein